MELARKIGEAEAKIEMLKDLIRAWGINPADLRDIGEVIPKRTIIMGKEEAEFQTLAIAFKQKIVEDVRKRFEKW